MNNLRLSVTDLDSYVWFKHSEQEPDELMRRLRKEEPPSPEMQRGIALHKALELARTGDFLSLQADGYSFNVLGDIELPLATLREVKAEYPVKISPNLTVTLVGKVDVLHGLTIEDHKGTSRFDGSYGAENYFRTAQWKYYLSIFKANRFIWNVFVLKEVDFREYDVVDFHRFDQYRYVGMESECDDLLREFLDFLGIEQKEFLPEIETPLATLLKANQ